MCSISINAFWHCVCFVLTGATLLRYLSYPCEDGPGRPDNACV